MIARDFSLNYRNTDYSTESQLSFKFIYVKTIRRQLRATPKMTKHAKVKYPVKNIRINTCANLYHKWKPEKPLYERAPKNGLTLDVEYVDTLTAIGGHSSDHKVMLCLHGAPGSHSDFAAIIDHMLRLSVRVIAPNFPGIAQHFGFQLNFDSSLTINDFLFNR